LTLRPMKTAAGGVLPWTHHIGRLDAEDVETFANAATIGFMTR
jgi:hypothetical protein